MRCPAGRRRCYPPTVGCRHSHILLLGRVPPHPRGWELKRPGILSSLRRGGVPHWCRFRVPRGFDMRLLTVAAAVLTAGVVAAQPIGVGFGGGGLNISVLVNNKAVQDDLKMTEEQVTKVGEWAKGFVARRQEILKDKGFESGKAGGIAKNDPEMQAKL